MTTYSVDSKGTAQIPALNGGITVSFTLQSLDLYGNRPRYLLSKWAPQQA